MESRNRSQSSGGGGSGFTGSDDQEPPGFALLKTMSSSTDRSNPFSPGSAFSDLDTFDTNHHNFNFNFGLMNQQVGDQIDSGQFANDKLIDSSSLIVNLFSNSLAAAAAAAAPNTNGDNNDYHSPSPSLSDPELSLMRATAAKNFNDALPSPTSTSPISGDDLVDKRDVLRQTYMDFFVKNECTIDTNLNTFMSKNAKLTKSMQRKLFHLHTNLTQASIYASELISQKFSDSSAINFIELTAAESDELVTKVMQVCN
jgi:hypothetical protein